MVVGVARDFPLGWEGGVCLHVHGIELEMFHGFACVGEEWRDLADTRGVELSFHGDRESYATLVRARDIWDAGTDDVFVGNDELGTVDRLETRAFHADAQYLACVCPDHDRVADLKGRIRIDRHRREEIREYPLQSEPKNHTGNAHTGEERSYVDAEIIEDDESDERKEYDTNHHEDDRYATLRTWDIGLPEETVKRILCDFYKHSCDEESKKDRNDNI